MTKFLVFIFSPLWLYLSTYRNSWYCHTLKITLNLKFIVQNISINICPCQNNAFRPLAGKGFIIPVVLLGLYA